MIGYVTLGTNDLAGHAPFYDAIAKEMGVGRMMDEDTFIAWGDMEGATWKGRLEAHSRNPLMARQQALEMAQWSPCRRVGRIR